MKTPWMRNAVGVFLAMPESIHQAARKGNLPMCDKATLPGGRKCSSDFVRRAPRVAERKVLDGHRKATGGLPAGRANGVGWPQMATGLSACWPQGSAAGFRKAG